MKERLLYMTIGVLIGIVVMQWGSSIPSGVVPVNAYYAGGESDIIAFTGGQQPHLGAHILVEDGSVWEFNWESGWVSNSFVSPPCPVTDVKFWGINVVITKSNDLWAYNAKGDNYPYYLEWHNYGPWPGSSVPAEESTFGKIKSLFKGKDQ